MEDYSLLEFMVSYSSIFITFVIEFDMRYFERVRHS